MPSALRRWALTSILSGVVVVSAHALAHAQDAAPAANPAIGADVVHMRDGGIVRGTVVENAPGRYVVVHLVTGENRRIEAGEVASVDVAGASQGASRGGPEIATSAPVPAVGALSSDPRQRSLGAVMGEGGLGLRGSNPETFQLRLTADEPDTTYYMITGFNPGYSLFRGRMSVTMTPAYERLCTAPCEMELPAGDYRFALGRGLHSPAPADGLVRVDRPLEVQGEYHSRSALRVAGIITMIGGGIGGIALSLLGFFHSTERCSSSGSCTDDPSISWPLAITGLILEIGSLVGGLIMSTQSDSAEVATRPATH